MHVVDQMFPHQGSFKSCQAKLVKACWPAAIQFPSGVNRHRQVRKEAKNKEIKEQQGHYLVPDAGFHPDWTLTSCLLPLQCFTATQARASSRYSRQKSAWKSTDPLQCKLCPGTHQLLSCAIKQPRCDMKTCPPASHRTLQPDEERLANSFQRPLIIWFLWCNRRQISCWTWGQCFHLAVFFPPTHC